MSSTAEKILEEALKLPEDDQDHLATAILAAMRHEPREEIERAWEEEVLRRIEQAERDGIQGREWESVYRELRAKYARK